MRHGAKRSSEEQACSANDAKRPMLKNELYDEPPRESWPSADLVERVIPDHVPGRFNSFNRRNPAPFVTLYVEDPRSFDALRKPPVLCEALVVETKSVLGHIDTKVDFDRRTNEFYKFAHYHTHVRLFINRNMIEELRAKLPDCYKSLKAALAPDKMKTMDFSKMPQSFRNQVERTLGKPDGSEERTALCAGDSCVVLKAWVNPRDLPEHNMPVSLA